MPVLANKIAGASRFSVAQRLAFHAPLFLLFFFSLARPGYAQTVRETQVKAALIFNFAQFTEWPAAAFERTNSPLVIGILGADPFGNTLAETMKGETVQGHPLRIDHYRTLAEVKNCHILYISQSEAGHLEAIVESLKNKSVLTVSEIDQAAYRGVVIRLFIKNNRVQFRINATAAKAASLNLSSKLLRVADEVIYLEHK